MDDMDDEMVIVEKNCGTLLKWTIGLIERREFLADGNRGGHEVCK